MRLLLTSIVAVCCLASCVSSSVIDAPLGQIWYHPTYGDAAKARDQFAKADAKAYQAYAKILAAVPIPQLAQLPDPGPTGYNFEGRSYSYGSYGYGASNFSGTITPRPNTNFVDSFNRGRQSAMVMQHNELAMAPLYAAQARAKQAYIDSMAAQGWKLKAK